MHSGGEDSDIGTIRHHDDSVPASSCGIVIEWTKVDEQESNDKTETQHAEKHFGAAETNVGGPQFN
jgi:hypothetical protein